MSGSTSKPVAAFGVTLLCLAIGFTASCSDSNDDKGAIAVAGTVRDSLGVVVPSARVAIEYLSPPHWLEQGCEIKLAFDRETDWTLEITDYRGDRVRLFQGRTSGGLERICWDWTDEDGHVVPDGVYLVHVVAGEFSVMVKRLVAAGCDGMSVSDAFLMHTDARGRYGIDWEIIPLGENVPVFDQFGHLIDTLRVSDTVRVCAWNDEAKGSVNAVLVEGGTVTADIVIR